MNRRQLVGVKIIVDIDPNENTLKTAS